MEWGSLRPIQVDAIHYLLDGRGDCIISAPTAGGKTEAAFLPILSTIADDHSDGIRAMYIGPLKALINDQFRRVGDLCERMEMPVHRWHGDVTSSARHKLLTRPSGVLLITPESLEAMFVLRPTKMRGLFSTLQFVVIDELHAFIGGVRGAQLRSQLYRLDERCGCRPVRIGLSATLGDAGRALEWLRPAGPAAALITDKDATRSVDLRVRAFWEQPKNDDEDEPERYDDDTVLAEVARSMLVTCSGRTNLAFANAKSRIEELADSLATQVRLLGTPDEVVVHHGSLSKEQREYAEERLRNSPRGCTAVCSNTLEMGIDVGAIDRVLQLSAPWSVASLTQRLGRSGRNEGASATLLGYFIVEAPTEDATVWRGLHLDFLQGLATIELMLERFVEPPDYDRPQLSTLIQQLMSSLAETGGTNAAVLYDRLITSNVFGRMTPSEFASLLRSMATVGLIEQMSEGDLILAPKGQRIVGHYSFYAAFVAPDEFTVLHGSDRIGRLVADFVPPQGEHVLLAGRRWRVDKVDAERKEVLVSPSRGRRPPAFLPFAGDLHPRIHEAMRELAIATKVPIYLDDTATAVLESLRQAATEASNFSPSVVGSSTGDRCRLFVWGGSRVQRTLHLVLRRAEFEIDDHAIGFDVKASVSDVRATLLAFSRKPGDGVDLARLADEELGARVVGAEKYDWAIPDPLWAKGYVASRLDLPGARVAALRLSSRAG